MHARRDELAQVISNLLQNAARYTPPGGRVEVVAALDRADAQVRVTNSGSEIPEADLPRVWERFFRVERSRDRSTGGAGIGLAIVKRLVEEAGGRVGASSEAGVDDVLVQPSDLTRCVGSTSAIGPARRRGKSRGAPRSSELWTGPRGAPSLPSFSGC